MSRLPRYLLIWLSCTAASVTAVMITVHFVVGSTRPTAPVAQSAPEGFMASPQSSSPAARPSPSPHPRPTPSVRTPPPTPSKTAEKPRTATPTPAARTTLDPPDEPPVAQPPEGQDGCEQGGSGVHTISSQGGKATVRYGSGGVCLISAVPGQGFTVSTSQTAPETLTVTFSAARHRSEITATTEPSDRASVRETSF
ncbi:hypothetical protein [Streptomyces peucetius]|uniref:Serine/threonine protein kinase n=1 Tax=Streptomyces peucetius TaxID=1950 RepID=A0ABY6IE87_STRPE|nr:hypothetical protein [Streptomyces peucetius]UYQ65315.1 hypothetical protein OGH68_30185 [Streptomyces peucetius]